MGEIEEPEEPFVNSIYPLFTPCKEVWLFKLKEESLRY